MSDDYSVICGITEQELLSQMQPDIERIAQANNETYEEACRHLKRQYDGYHFSKICEDIYNPFSLFNAFSQRDYKSFWFSTGTPTFLIEMLQRMDFSLTLLEKMEVKDEDFDKATEVITDPIPVLYQSGYLTIKDYDPEFGLYMLDYPNREVEEGFVKYLMPFYIDKSEAEAPFEIRRFVGEVRNGNIDGFFHRLQSFFADAPYEVIVGQDPVRNVELFFQNVLFIVFRLAGFYTQVEYHTSRGRIDLVLKTDKFIYVMEFKQGATAEEALAQINEKGYADAFASDSRTLYKIGVSFSDEQRNIERWLVE